MKRLLYILLLICLIAPLAAQEKKDISKMTKEDVLELTYDELLEMPFEDVMKLAEIVGVSLDELYEMLLNKDVVSASKKVESSFEAPLSTSVVSYDEIVNSGARTIEEALRLVPGMIVREKTNGNFDIHIRGNDNTPPKHMLLYSENSITLVMIDGRPVYNYVHGGTFWETLPIGIDDVDRIEVVRGPSSALYGPNAVSGVVNIITKKEISKKLDVDANVQASSQSTYITSMGIGKQINKKFKFRITGNFETFDRNTDKLYVYLANKGEGGFITKEELDTLRDPSNPNYYVFDPTDNVDDMYPDPMNSRYRYGVNGYLFYDINKDINFNLKGGNQYSEVLSTTMGDNPTSFAGRVSNTSYVDFNANIHGLKVQTNLLNGYQDIVRQDTGFKVDVQNVNASVEYDLHIGKLNLRPGYYYQLAKYDDLNYLRYNGQGFLNGDKQFNTNALSLRADYKAWDKLRFIGALRGEKYNTHDKIYFTYQLIGAYEINENNLFRIVYSKANRSPFLVDTYANYFWERTGRQAPGYIQFSGQKNLDLLTMNMGEIGYRLKPAKNIMVDIEAFYSHIDNYGALYPDSVNLVGVQNDTGRFFVNMKYDNIDLNSEQFGVTSTFSWVINENLVLKVFGTLQTTTLRNAIIETQDGTIASLVSTAYGDSTLSSTSFPKQRETIKNTATPKFYGGLILDYKTLEDKLEINLNTYFYTKQDFYSKYSKQDIDFNYIPEIIESKLIANAKISYNIFKPVNVFINVRNLFGTKREFAYMDDIGSLFLIGTTVDL